MAPPRGRAGAGCRSGCSPRPPLALEHLTGSWRRAVEHFGGWDAPVQLRWTTKHGKFGSVKYVYPPETMSELRGWFEERIADRLPGCRVPYRT